MAIANKLYETDASLIHGICKGETTFELYLKAP